MAFASFLGALATLVWVAIVGYVIFVIVQRTRGKDIKVSLSLIAMLVVLALLFSTLSAGVVVIDAREVGVVFNDFYGLRQDSLGPGLHIVTPFVDHVYRYTTIQQSYTMSSSADEGAMIGDDSLWSRTIDGQKVSIDATVLFELNPAKAAYVHAKWQDRYLNDFVRPAVRGVARSAIAMYGVEEVYSLKRAELQATIEEELGRMFDQEGLTLKGFVIRNVNFTEEYATSIEKKQIAEQEAQRMKFVVDREKLEAQRKREEAEGVKDAAVIRAEGEAEALRLISEALAANPDLLTYRYIEKLAPNVSVLMLPSGAPFILDPGSLLPAAGALAAPEPTPTPAP